jgi:hypothetical protein
VSSYVITKDQYAFCIAQGSTVDSMRRLVTDLPEFIFNALHSLAPGD